MENGISQNRILIICCFFVIWFVIISLKLTYIQVISHQSFSKSARLQRETEEALTINSRGDIVSRNNWILATSETKNSFFIDPQTISTEKFEELSNQLASIIPDIDKFKERFQQDKVFGKRFTWIERRVSNEKADKINSLNSSWIKSQKEYVRVYPNQYLASSVLGHTTPDQIGEKGLEKSLEKYLTFKKLRTIYTIDEQNQNYDKNSIEESKKIVVTTLDEAIQNSVEILLEESVKKTNAIKGTVIVLSPNSGEILAMANYSSIDPIKCNEFSSELVKNPAIECIYEPGEAFEPFAKIALLEMTGDRSVLENRINCEGGIDKKKYFEQMQNLGFRDVTNVDLPDEKHGSLENYESWHKRKICKILEKGQEIAVTPLHIASSTGMLANSGIWVQPYIVLRVNTENGKIDFETKPYGRRVIKRGTAKEIVKSLIEKNSVDKKFRLGNFIGIEGSSYKLNSNRQYETSRQTITVTGFFPADTPKFVVTLMIDEPQNVDSTRQIIIEDYHKILKAVSGKYSLQ